MVWLAIMERDGGPSTGSGAALRFHVQRAAACAVSRLFPGDAPLTQEEAAKIPTEDLDAERLDEWTEDQLARRSQRRPEPVPDRFWDELARGGAGEEAEEGPPLGTPQLPQLIWVGATPLKADGSSCRPEDQQQHEQYCDARPENAVGDQLQQEAEH
ncbi:MAG: hypothetical protein QOH04_2843 [Sphingomonadales bacterium]|jgi:hypothetical protein|nr:hypothetical protein [Sphingomonadales bacterium]